MDTTEIMKIAAELGQKLKSTEVGTALEKAKAAYESNEELRASFVEYDVQRKILSEQAGNQEIDTDLVTRIDTRVDELYDFIINHPIYKEYEQAQTAMNNLVQSVTGRIVSEITGQPQSSCTHDCSSCGGCH